MPLYKKKKTLISSTDIVRVRDIEVLGPSTTRVMEIDNFAGRTVKWIIDIVDDLNDHFSSLEILSTRNDIDVEYTSYALIGKDIDFSADIFTDGLVTYLEITNNELTPLLVSVASIIP